VRDAAALEALVAQAVEVVGGIDVSLHAAGVATAGGFLASPVDDWRWVFDVNVLGTVHSCRAVLPQMQAQRSGLVINIASAAGFATNAKIASYNSAKAAVIALSEALMQGFAQFDIQVVAAMPGFFRTRLLDAARGRTHFVYPSRYQWLWRLKRLSPGRFQTWLPRLLSR
jgi:NAD(P)-dependent dehydrogenase (short-subunit alcohol dehydrogenase family)